MREFISPIGLSLIISIMALGTMEESYHLPVYIHVPPCFYVGFGIYIYPSDDWGKGYGYLSDN